MTKHRIHARKIHFARRVRERISASINTDLLWSILIREIEADNQGAYLRFICRINRDGLRLWRFILDGKTCFVIYDHEMQCPVTVLAKGTVARLGKAALKLEYHID